MTRRHKKDQSSAPMLRLHKPIHLDVHEMAACLGVSATLLANAILYHSLQNTPEELSKCVIKYNREKS